MEDGLRFTNSWPDQALFLVAGPRGVQIGIGNANRGLCGGMVFTALDVFVAGLPPLEDSRPPPQSVLYRYLVRRLFDSFDIPIGVVDYYRSMIRCDQAAGVRTLQEWTAVKAELDSGRPCPLGLVTTQSANPVQLGQNHQVLAYAYHQDRDRLTIRVYDPNTERATADDVQLSVNLGPRSQVGAVTHNVKIGRPIRGFFRVRYRPADPRCLSTDRGT